MTDERRKSDEYNARRIIKAWNELQLPIYMREGALLYTVAGVWPGSFLTAVLEHRFMDMCTCADDYNQHHLYNYAKLMYSFMPAESYGSPEATNRWTESHRQDYQYAFEIIRAVEE